MIGPTRFVARANRVTAWRKEIPGRVLVSALILVAAIAPVSGIAIATVVASSCDDGVEWKDVPASRGDAGIDSIQVTSSTGKLSGTIFVRVDTSGSQTKVTRLLIDTDQDRMTGMWTAQSDLSAAGWDHVIDEWSNIYRHHGNPRMWEWNRIDAAGVVIEHSEAGYRYCIPASALALGDSRRIRVAAENEDISLPLRFLPGVPFPHTDDGPKSEPVRAPGRMVFNYSGVPWNVRECTTSPDPNECAAQVYGRFAHVVLGARLEEPGRSGHDGTLTLIQTIRTQSPDTEIWGYISIVGSPKNDRGIHPEVYSAREYLKHVRMWKQMGATGVFIDEYDICNPNYENCQYGPGGVVPITREHQQKVVRGVHRMGLAAFVNGNSPFDAMSSYEGQASPLGPAAAGRAADMYLLENPTVSDGEYATGVDFEANLAKFLNVIRLNQETGVRIGVLDSMPGYIPDEATDWPMYRLGWWRAAQANAAAYSFFGKFGHHGNVPVLDPPADALRFKAHFEQNGIEALGNGWETRRYVADCTGGRIGRVVVERIAQDGTAVGGYVATAAPDPSC